MYELVSKRRVMRNWKMTTTRTLLYCFLIIAGIIYFIRNGLQNLSFHELIASLILFGILVLLVIYKFSNLKKGTKTF